MYSERFTALTGNKSVARPWKTRPAPASWFSHVHPGVTKPRARCPGDTGPDTRVGGGCLLWPDWSSARQTHTRVVRRVSSHAEKEFISEPDNFVIPDPPPKRCIHVPSPEPNSVWALLGLVARHLPSAGPRGSPHLPQTEMPRPCFSPLAPAGVDPHAGHEAGCPKQLGRRVLSSRTPEWTSPPGKPHGYQAVG